MPGKAWALKLFPDSPGTAEGVTMQWHAESLAPAEHPLLLHLQRQALEYFLDNQLANGLVLDRQRNHGPRPDGGVCSTAATGMGFMALALASATPYALLSQHDATLRIRTGLQTALTALPHEQGIVPHFVDSETGAVMGCDRFSTIDSSWLIAGALWSAAFLRDEGLGDLARRLYERVDWRHWSLSDPASERVGQLHHGQDQAGRFLPCTWDRLNGETVFMYVLAAGAAAERALPARTWRTLRLFHGSVAGHHFNNADLGLFVFQYGLDLLDLSRWQSSTPLDLHAEARLAAWANHDHCREQAHQFKTYRRFWGLSAGDGPGSCPGRDSYRSYSPAGPIDGTAHLTATLASVAHAPEQVLRNLGEARHERKLEVQGRYGFSNLNLDHHWVARDMVGIDAGAAVLALDNCLMENRVREVFHRLPCVERGLAHLGLTRRDSIRLAS